MRLEQLSCPACAASISVAPTVVERVCPYCGATLHVQREEGEASLLVLERVTDAITTSQARTTAAIGQSTAVTQDELRRLQHTQELYALEVQLASIQSEMRALQRMPSNKVIKRQIRELQDQHRYLVARIAEIRAILDPRSVQQPLPYATGSGGHGCIGGAILAVLWVCFSPIMLLGKMIQSDSKLIRGFGLTIAGFVLFGVALGNMTGDNSVKRVVTTSSVSSPHPYRTATVSPTATRTSTPTVQSTPPVAPKVVDAPIELLAAPIPVAQTGLTEASSSIFPTPTPDVPNLTATAFSLSKASGGSQRFQNGIIAFNMPATWTVQTAGADYVVIVHEYYELRIGWTVVSNGVIAHNVDSELSNSPADAVQAVLDRLSQPPDASGEVKSISERAEKEIAGVPVIGSAYQALVLAPGTNKTGLYYIADFACAEYLVCATRYNKPGLIPFSDRDQEFLNSVIGSIEYLQK